MQRRVGWRWLLTSQVYTSTPIFDGQVVQDYERLSQDLAPCSYITKHDMQMAVLTNDRQGHFFVYFARRVLPANRVAREQGTGDCEQNSVTNVVGSYELQWVAYW